MADLLDWPGFVGREAHKKPLAALLKFDAQFKQFLFRNGLGFCLDSVLDIDTQQLTGLIAELEAIIDAAIFNGGLSAFKSIDSEADLRVWLQTNPSLPAYLLNDLYRRNWATVGQNPVDCLPDLNSSALISYLSAQDLSSYSRLPHWQGRCFETTVLNRQWLHPLMTELQIRYHNGLLVRLVARLLEVCRIPSGLRHLLTGIHTGAVLGADGEHELGIGWGQTQAARGLLMHRVALRHGRVIDYGIVAPTEWNFHPQGVTAQGLKALQADDATTLSLQAELLINAIDPCVKYDLKLYDCDKAPEIHA